MMLETSRSKHTGHSRIEERSVWSVDSRARFLPRRSCDSMANCAQRALQRANLRISATERCLNWRVKEANSPTTTNDIIDSAVQATATCTPT